VENLSAHSIAGLSPGQQPDSGFDRGTDASGPPLGACSACAGDYEDPDLTAWPRTPEEADEDAPYGTSDLLPDQAQTRAEDERNIIKFPDARE
jgi:hypothetical protein